MTESKYGHLVKTLVFQKGTMGGANARELVFVGGKELAGFDLNFIVGVYEKPEGTTDGQKYTHLFKKMEVKKGPGGADAKQMFAMSGDELEGSTIHFQMGLYNETGSWQPGKGALVHPYDKCIVFFGHNTDDLSYLGAEITIDIGKEHEKHTFDVPTVISIPKGTPHFPVVCNRVDRPYRVMQVGLAAEVKSSYVD